MAKKLQIIGTFTDGSSVKSVNGVLPDEDGNVNITSVGFVTDETLTMSPEGVLSVNTATELEPDNTLPVTSAAVYSTIGNINALLETI